MTIAIMLYMNLKKEGKFQTVSPMKMPSAPNMATLGTMSELGNDIYKQMENEQERLRQEAIDERDRRELRGRVR